MSQDSVTSSSRWLTAEQAIERLGVSRATLYAYVSRHLIGTMPAGDDSRRSLYDAVDIARLAERNRRGRSRQAVATSTISWGEPILASGITRIEAGRLEYREQDVVALSDHATLEDIAMLLWQAGDWPPLSGGATPWPRVHATTGVAERCIAALACQAMLGRWSGRLDAVLPDAMRLVEHMAWAACGHTASRVTPSALPIHRKLASAWGVSAKAAEVIRRALVLVADHELNASTYAARVVASTRAPLGACVLAGLSALVGPLHGGMTEEARALVASPGILSDPQGAVAARLARGETIPAFGHRLYPDGDPRAMALLRVAAPPAEWQRLIDAVQAQTGLSPNIDFALLTVERRLRLPMGAAFALFAVGRSVGWIAHALEQWQGGKLIRPRAIYRRA